MANIKSLKGQKLQGPSLVAIASNLDDPAPEDFKLDKPPGIPDNLFKLIDMKNEREVDLRNRLFSASCAAPFQRATGNPKTSPTAGYATIIRLYPNADAPTKAKRTQDAPMRGGGLGAMTIPADDLERLRSNWREYYQATTPEAVEKWERENQMGVKTADLSAIARMRNAKERAAALRDLATKEERGFAGYLQDRFEMTPLILGMPDEN